MRHLPNNRNGICRRCKKHFLKNCKSHFHCEECAKEITRERNRIYDRKRRQSQHRKDWEKNWRATIGKEKKAIRDYSYQKYWKELIEEKQCCEICGSKENLEMHHVKYEKSKDMQLVCKTCHLNIHWKK